MAEVEQMFESAGGSEPIPADLDALYLAWVVIANVSGGDWSQQPVEWQIAARRWRDEIWHGHYDMRRTRPPLPADGDG